LVTIEVGPIWSTRTVPDFDPAAGYDSYMDQLDA
jgi:hypothetical protein